MVGGQTHDAISAKTNKVCGAMVLPGVIEQDRNSYKPEPGKFVNDRKILNN
jgi:hypothetical protein